MASRHFRSSCPLAFTLVPTAPAAKEGKPAGPWGARARVHHRMTSGVTSMVPPASLLTLPAWVIWQSHTQVSPVGSTADTAAARSRQIVDPSMRGVNFPTPPAQACPRGARGAQTPRWRAAGPNPDAGETAELAFDSRNEAENYKPSGVKDQ